MSSNSLEDMIQAAIHNLKFCYAPYSRFKVSCVLESTDGRLFSGVNVENVSYGLTVCAERTAICKAVSEGCLNFQRIVITCHDPNVNITPCGACRQVLYELEVYSISLKEKFVESQEICQRDYIINGTKKTVQELIPGCFDDLKQS